jgi:NDP-sugar pyrophosphorylase family protein
MRAMILAAGLGTRLQPITNNLPKALVKIHDKTLLEITINHLVKNGFDQIIINVHHFAEQIIQFIKENNFNAEIIISDERNELLDTGGGLKKASWFFGDGKPFLLYNVDIITNLNLHNLYQANIESNSIATLAIRKRESSRYLLFNSENILCGWKNTKTGEIISIRKSDSQNEFAFSGIHIINPKIFSLMPDDDVFSMIDLYLYIMRFEKIIAHIDTDSFWLDVGKPESLKIAEENFHLIDNL